MADLATDIDVALLLSTGAQVCLLAADPKRYALVKSRAYEIANRIHVRWPSQKDAVKMAVRLALHEWVNQNPEEMSPQSLHSYMLEFIRQAERDGPIRDEP